MKALKKDDLSVDFVYRYKLGKDLLDISIIRVGDRKLYDYGLTMYETPLFQRINA